MPEHAIKVEGVSKAYKGARRTEAVSALNGVSFEAASGEIFGLIGPDGSGKTTLMRIITSLILADNGNVAVQGLDVRREFAKVRNLIGYMPGRFSLYQDLTVEENLKFFGKIFGVDIDENMRLIDAIYSQILPFKDRLAGKLSGGMKQKLALCCALIHKPEILVLDEPTTGVDPVSRQEFWDILGEIKKSGITVLVSTPYMDEAARCDKIAFILDGRIMKIDSPAGIVDAFPEKIAHVKSHDMFELLNLLRMYPHTAGAYAFGDSNHVVLKGGGVEGLEEFLRRNGHPDAEVGEAHAGLEDCFMNMKADHAEH